MSMTPKEYGENLPHIASTEEMLASIPNIEYDATLSILVAKAGVSDELPKITVALVEALAAVTVGLDHATMIEVLQTTHRRWHVLRKELQEFNAAGAAHAAMSKAAEKGDGDKPKDQ